MPMILAYTSGVFVAHALRRGPQFANDVSNVCLDTTHLAVTVLTFRALQPEAHNLLGIRTLFALAVAMTASALLGQGLMNVSIWFEELSVNIRAATKALGYQVIASLVNSCLAITALVFALDHPFLLLVLAPPMVLVFTGQLASFKQQQQAKRMQFMYEISEALHSGGNLITHSAQLVDHMVEQFRASRAELIMLADRTRALHVYSHLKGVERTDTRDLSLREHDLLEFMLASNRSIVRWMKTVSRGMKTKENRSTESD